MKEISFVISEQWKKGQVDDTFFLDHIFNTTQLELKPRVYRGDWGQLVWCVEIIDWLANKHIIKVCEECVNKKDREI